jgi:hypothetical protein
MDVFFITSSGKLDVDTYNGTSWAGPTALPGTPRAGTSLAATSPSTGYANLFFINSSGQLVSDSWTSSGGWHYSAVALPGTPEPDTPLAATSPSKGNMDVFFIGFVFIGNDQLREDAYSSSAGWVGPGLAPGTPLLGAPLAATSCSGEVFITYMPDNSIQFALDAHSSGGWVGPVALLGTPEPEAGTGLAMTCPSAGDESSFYITTSGQMEIVWWLAPTTLPGAPEARWGLAATSPSTRDMDVLFISSSGQLVSDGWNGSVWSSGTAALPV